MGYIEKKFFQHLCVPTPLVLSCVIVDFDPSSGSALPQDRDSFDLHFERIPFQLLVGENFNLLEVFLVVVRLGPPLPSPRQEIPPIQFWKLKLFTISISGLRVKDGYGTPHDGEGLKSSSDFQVWDVYQAIPVGRDISSTHKMVFL